MEKPARLVFGLVKIRIFTLLEKPTVVLDHRHRREDGSPRAKWRWQEAQPDLRSSSQSIDVFISKSLSSNICFFSSGNPRNIRLYTPPPPSV